MVDPGLGLAANGVGDDITKFDLFPMRDDLEVDTGIAGACLLLAARIQGCRKAAWGFIRLSGSHVKHLAIKSRKSSSLHFSTVDSVFEPGRRRLPFALTKGRGAPVASKNLFLLDALSTMYRSGTPNTSMIQANCSSSFSPGKIGTPV